MPTSDHANPEPAPLQQPATSDDCCSLCGHAIDDHTRTLRPCLHCARATGLCK